LLWYQAASSDMFTFLARATFGRYCLIDIVGDFLTQRRLLLSTSQSFVTLVGSSVYV
jgi:hypothetical protein